MIEGGEIGEKLGEGETKIAMDQGYYMDEYDQYAEGMNGLKNISKKY